MDTDVTPIAAATLAAAILAKMQLPPDTDAAREAMRLYRSTLRKIRHFNAEEAKAVAAGAAGNTAD